MRLAFRMRNIFLAVAVLAAVAVLVSELRAARYTDAGFGIAFFAGIPLACAFVAHYIGTDRPAAWLAICWALLIALPLASAVALLLGPAYHRDAELVIFYASLPLSFPSVFVFGTIAGTFMMVLRWGFGEPEHRPVVSLLFTWAVAATASAAQWFWLAPRLSRWIRSRYGADAAENPVSN